MSDTQDRLPGYRAIVNQLRIEIGTMLGQLLSDQDLANRLHNTLTAYGAFQSLMLVLHETDVPVEERAGVLRELRTSAKCDIRPGNQEIVDFVHDTIHNLHMAWEEEAPIPLDYVPQMVDGSNQPPDGLSEKALAKWLAAQYHETYVDLIKDDVAIDISGIRLVSGDLCRKHILIPLYRKNCVLTIAISDPSNPETSDEVRFNSGYEVDVVVSPRNQILALIDQYYPPGELQDVDDGPQKNAGTTYAQTAFDCIIKILDDHESGKITSCLPAGEEMNKAIERSWWHLDRLFNGLRIEINDRTERDQFITSLAEYVDQAYIEGKQRLFSGEYVLMQLIVTWCSWNDVAPADQDIRHLLSVEAAKTASRTTAKILKQVQEHFDESDSN